MATLLELKTRVYEEMNSRTDIEPGVGDLSGALTRAIEQAIDFYADEEFWWNQYIASANTSNGTDNISKPSEFRRVKSITLPALNSALEEIGIEALVNRQSVSSVNGPPSYWAEYDGNLKLYPTPNATYALTLVGVEDIGVPATDGASNSWTTEAYDLIAARARMVLYRDQFRDTEGAGVASLAMDEAYRDLRRNTSQRLKRPLRNDIPGPGNYFNINSGGAV